MKTKRIFSIVLLSALIVTSCGDTSTSVDTEDSTTTADDTGFVYDYPEADYNEYEFNFLNVEEQYWADVTIAPEETSGDLVKDAQYHRNARIEERYNITIKEHPAQIDDLHKQLIRNVTADDDVYDVYMVSLHNIGAVITEGYLADLNTIDSLNLDMPWWDQRVNESFEINGKLMLTTSDISFFPFEATWAIFFNEDMFEDLGLDLPYDSVRAGTWTFDELSRLAKAGAALNGDDQFTAAYDETKNCRYGLGTHTFPLQMVHAAGESYIKIENGKARFVADTEKLFNLYEKIADMSTPANGAHLNTTVDLFDKFNSKRLMMFGETLGYLSDLRESEINFGVLPLPKYDETQDKYYSLIAQWGTGSTTVPITAENPERTGVILDALAYDSYVNIIDVYYDTYLTQKGLRNDDSVEMVQIIRENRSPAIEMAFGWTTIFNTELQKTLKTGNSNVASILASYKTSVEESANSTLEKLTK